MDSLKAFMMSPVGPRTIHFWGPVANWGFVVAGLMDANKPAECISARMTGTLMFYSCLFMRFAWQVAPRNYILFACHACNASAQGYLLARRLRYDYEQTQSAAANNTEQCTPCLEVQRVA